MYVMDVASFSLGPHQQHPSISPGIGNRRQMRVPAPFSRQSCHRHWSVWPLASLLPFFCGFAAKNKNQNLKKRQNRESKWNYFGS